MSIKSHAFGRVVLTEADAAKFNAQVTYGRPKAAAHRNAAAGLALSRELRDNGVIKIKLRAKEPA